MSHRASGGDDSPEPCYGNATRRVSKGARKPAEDSYPKTAFSMLWHDMYPHVIVSLEPGDVVVFWQDVMYSGVAWPSRKTATTNVSSVSDQNAGIR
jgi:hypothetical protein